ncbi:hypothetical protein EDC04DRAFT_2602747 [Pisolithus marmoratus]|nr:hypothetical protein EDC04DRAFT_2602747 [Pisolithus marmoratus]
MLAKKHYPSFKQTWFTNRSDERTANSTKHKVKTETMVGDMVSPTLKHAKIHLGSQSDNGNDNIGDNFVVNTPGNLTSRSTASDMSVVKQGDTGFKISPSLIKNPLSSVYQKEPPMYTCPPQQLSSMSLPVEEGRNPTSACGSNDHVRGGLSQVSHANINGGMSLTVAKFSM